VAKKSSLDSYGVSVMRKLSNIEKFARNGILNNLAKNDQSSTKAQSMIDEKVTQRSKNRKMTGKSNSTVKKNKNNSFIANHGPIANTLTKYKRLVFKDLDDKQNSFNLPENIFKSSNHGRNVNKSLIIEGSTTKEKRINKTSNGTKVSQHVKTKSFDLYERSRDKSLQKKLLCSELEKMKFQKEVQGCTFQPVVNNNIHSRNSLKIYKIDDQKREIDFHDRNTVWTTKKSEKIELIKNFKVKKDDECTFHPKINKSIPNLVNDCPDKNTKKYFERVKNARKMKEEIQEKLESIHKNASSTCYLKKNDNNFRNQNKSNENNVFKKIELGAVKTSLRNHLHSIKFNDEF